jgi:hypothetical protein
MAGPSGPVRSLTHSTTALMTAGPLARTDPLSTVSPTTQNGWLSGSPHGSTVRYDSAFTPRPSIIVSVLQWLALQWGERVMLGRLRGDAAG